MMLVFFNSFDDSLKFKIVLYILSGIQRMLDPLHYKGELFIRL